MQLWAQSSKVTIIGKTRRGGDSLQIFDDESASSHSLMPRLKDPENLQGKVIDLIVWPRVQVTRFNSVYPHGGRLITTKASIFICDPKACQANKAKLEKAKELSPDAIASQVPVQEVPSCQDPEGTVHHVDQETHRTSENALSEQNNGFVTDGHQQLPLQPTTTSEEVRKVCNVLFYHTRNNLNICSSLMLTN